jgi:hypothetical protein
MALRPIVLYPDPVLLTPTERVDRIAHLDNLSEIQARLAVETELRKTNEILGAPNAAKAGPVEATLDDGMVVDVKENLALVIANIGEKQGVSIGMPFQVWRDDKRIGEVRVVDVRRSISGAVIQSLESEKVPVKTGDRLKVDARR